MSAQTLLFVASKGPQDLSLARREPDGTLRRAEYANINWIERLAQGSPCLVSLDPHADEYYLSARLREMTNSLYTPKGSINVAQAAAGYFVAMKHYHGSDARSEIAEAPIQLEEISNAIGVDWRGYDPERSSTNKLNWTIRLWERIRA